MNNKNYLKQLEKLRKVWTTLKFLQTLRYTAENKNNEIFRENTLTLNKKGNTVIVGLKSGDKMNQKT